ncbi:MAG TPA: purine-nucleoside phosphorylase [Clostridiales bacterium]|nr:purine-nucleoside phosphorylase [Clostridiales bacterium]
MAMEHVDEAARFLRDRGWGGRSLAIVLGSGLDILGGDFEVDGDLAFTAVPHFLPATVAGHAGRLLRARLKGVPSLVMRGRLHYCEGLPLSAVVFPIRVLARLGVRTLVLTNAAGAVNRKLSPGDLMLVTDHLNLLGDNPLRGPNLDELGPRFPPMAAAYSPELARRARAAAVRAGVRLHKGVYAAVAGPSYETAAEARLLRRMGADAVGMSTVPEVIAARHAGMSVLVLSCIANRVGVGAAPDHEDVLAVVRAAAPRVGRLLRELAPALGEQDRLPP